VPLTDSRPFHNPLVVCFDHLLQISVRKQPRRNIRPHRRYFGPYLHTRLQRQTQTLTSKKFRKKNEFPFNNAPILYENQRPVTPLRTHRPLGRKYPPAHVHFVEGEEVQGVKKMYRATHCARNDPLPLLPSGPGGVGGITSRRTRHTIKFIIA